MLTYGEMGKEMRNICVIIGAGADAPFGIATGGDFAANVLGTSPITGSKMNESIKQHYLRIIPRDDDWYPSYNTYKVWEENDIVKASLRKRNLEKARKISDEDFKKEFEDLIVDSAERDIVKRQYPSYMGILDGKFSTLIAPSILGRGKFWQVVSCYCRAYLTIVQQVLGRDDYDEFLNPTETLLREIRNTSKKQSTIESYYSIIYKKRATVDVSVVTTNYTLFCEEIAELMNDKIAYVHGRIGLYESPRDLCVYDVEKDRFEREIVFPYLFIQSGIKPIVERRQIEEYGKMIRFIDDAEKIIIVGYRLNHDDNHINSIIRSAVKLGKEVVYLSFNDGNMDFLRREDVINKLRLAGNPSNLKWYEITSKDAYSVFDSELE